MPEFANHAIRFSVPRDPSIGWCKQVAHAAGVWPDAETVPEAIWMAVLNYHRAMKMVDAAERAHGIQEIDK